MSAPAGATAATASGAASSPLPAPAPGSDLQLALPIGLVAVLALGAAVVAAALARRAGEPAPRRLVRALLAATLVAALAAPRWAPSAAPVVLVVDASPSVAPSGGAAFAGGADAGAVRLELGGAGAPGSDLGAGLDRARALLGGRAGRVLLASDGRDTGGAAEEAAARIAAEGGTVDVAVLPPRHALDAGIASLSLPRAVRAGDVVAAEVVVRATARLTVTLRVEQDGREVQRREVAVPAGDAGAAVTVRLEAPRRAGVMRVAAAIDAVDDQAANDRLEDGALVAPPPRVLVVGDGSGAVGLADALTAAGTEATVLGAARLPATRSALEPFDALVVADVSAADLARDQLAAVRAFVAESGRGLVLTGGRQSYAQGGWRGTELERLSPLALDPPPRSERDPMALLVMVDRSASMGGGDSRSRLTKLDLAREAAILAAEVLHPGDALAVMAYDDEARWLLPFAAMGQGLDLGGVERALAGLETGGGTRILSALETGLPVLAQRDAPTRHAILISDGRDAAEDAGPQEAAVAAAAAAGATVSTIAVGLDADDELLARLARVGRGRHHVAREAAELPRLAAEESAIVRARSEQTGAFPVRPAGGDAERFLRRIGPAELPPVEGYLALAPRPEASVALAVGPDDPLLATWRVGLGEVAAWTSDAGERWAGGWHDGGAAAFWDGLVRAVARPPEPSPALEVLARDDGEAAAIEVAAVAPDGGPLDLAEGEAVITGTARSSSAPFAQVGPGRYAARVPWPDDEPGAREGAATLARSGARLAAPFVARREPDPEWRLGRPGDALLAAVAEAGGGDVIDPPAALALVAAPGPQRDLWPWLLAAAVVLWPLDVYLGLGRGRGPDPRPAPRRRER